MASPETVDTLTFRDDILVEPVPELCCGSDRWFAMSAWVERPGRVSPAREDTHQGYRRVIGAMIRGKHTSPFEKGIMCVYCEAPAVVWWEWTRHRFMSLDAEDMSFSLESGRYKILDGEFYVPAAERPIVEPSGFKSMRPTLGPADADLLGNARAELVEGYTDCWERYNNLIRMGVGREVARLSLPFSIYYAGYVSANPLTWLHFLSLRTRHETAAVKSYPQWEIEKAAIQCERIFKERWPITHDEWHKAGRFI